MRGPEGGRGSVGVASRIGGGEARSSSISRISVMPSPRSAERSITKVTSLPAFKPDFPAKAESPAGAFRFDRSVPFGNPPVTEKTVSRPLKEAPVNKWSTPYVTKETPEFNRPIKQSLRFDQLAPFTPHISPETDVKPRIIRKDLTPKLPAMHIVHKEVVNQPKKISLQKMEVIPAPKIKTSEQVASVALPEPIKPVVKDQKPLPILETGIKKESFTRPVEPPVLQEEKPKEAVPVTAPEVVSPLTPSTKEVKLEIKPVITDPKPPSVPVKTENYISMLEKKQAAVQEQVLEKVKQEVNKENPSPIVEKQAAKRIDFTSLLKKEKERDELLADKSKVAEAFVKAGVVADIAEAQRKVKRIIEEKHILPAPSLLPVEVRKTLAKPVAETQSITENSTAEAVNGKEKVQTQVASVLEKIKPTNSTTVIYAKEILAEEEKEEQKMKYFVDDKAEKARLDEVKAAVHTIFPMWDYTSKASLTEVAQALRGPTDATKSDLAKQLGVKVDGSEIWRSDFSKDAAVTKTEAMQMGEEAIAKAPPVAIQTGGLPASEEDVARVLSGDY